MFDKLFRSTNRDFALEFKNLLQEVVTIPLKEMGFKKKGLNYYRRIDNDFAQVLNVQMNHNNDKNMRAFLFNYGFFVPKLYSIMWEIDTFYKVKKTGLPDFPKAVGDYCIGGGRMGFVINGQESWYILDKRNSLKSISQQFKQDVDSRLIPMFKEISSINALLDLYRIKFEENKYRIWLPHAIVEFEFGNFEIGKKYLLSSYERAVGNPQYSIVEWQKIAEKYKIELPDIK
jgi:hypothetical protein